MSEKVDSYSSAATSVTREESQPSLMQIKSESDVSLRGDLNIADYLRDVPPTKKVVQDISVWTEEQRETTRTKLVLWLVKLLGYSLLGIFVLTGVATFNPKADKELIKGLVPQLITTQVTLLGVAFGYYFSNKED